MAGCIWPPVNNPFGVYTIARVVGNQVGYVIIDDRIENGLMWVRDVAWPFIANKAAQKNEGRTQVTGFGMDEFLGNPQRSVTNLKYTATASWFDELRLRMDAAIPQTAVIYYSPAAAMFKMTTGLLVPRTGAGP